MDNADAKTRRAGGDQSKTQSTVLYVVMLADVTGSTKLYDELGDETAKSIISQAINRI